MKDLATEGKLNVQIPNGENNIIIYAVNRNPSLLNMIFGIGSICKRITDNIERNSNNSKD